jgi:hypothetical protein
MIDVSCVLRQVPESAGNRVRKQLYCLFLLRPRSSPTSLGCLPVPPDRRASTFCPLLPSSSPAVRPTVSSGPCVLLAGNGLLMVVHRAGLAFLWFRCLSSLSLSGLDRVTAFLMSSGSFFAFRPPIRMAVVHCVTPPLLIFQTHFVYSGFVQRHHRPKRTADQMKLVLNDQIRRPEWAVGLALNPRHPAPSRMISRVVRLDLRGKKPMTKAESVQLSE